MITNFATEAIFIVGLVFGLDRFLKSRASRLWKPMGVMIVDELKVLSDIADTIQARTLDYCERAYGGYEVPEGHWYPDSILLEALHDPETWAADEYGPGLADQVTGDFEKLNERFSKWAPVLIAEPNLASIAAQTTALIQVSGRMVFALQELEFGIFAFPDHPFGKAYFGAMLTECVKRHQDLSLELWKQTTLYTTGQPLQFYEVKGTEGR